jgi:sigma-B regulation protein RsbU (phosphoserine phosphatase)
LVVLPVLVIAAALVILASLTASRISESLGRDVLEGAARAVAAEVRGYLGQAVRVSNRYTRRIESSVLEDHGLISWERPMLDDLATTPAVASICFGNVAGDTTWLLRGPGRLEIGRVEGASGKALEYAVDPVTCEPLGAPTRDYTYDPRKRPWWDAAIKADGPCWTPVYLWYADNNADSMIGTGYTRRIESADGSLRGVLVVDVTLGALNNFLKGLDFSATGTVLILDNGNRLIAASRGRVTDEAGNCYEIAKAPDPVTQAVAAAMSEPESSRHLSRMLRVNLNGAPWRAQLTELNPYPGVNWRVVAVLPESAFLADAHKQQREAIGLAVAAVLGALVLALLLARRLSRPIISVTEHVKKVGEGDFGSRLSLSGAKELVVLSDEINHMAGGLQQRMVLEQSLAVAMEVQQSLLPPGDPASEFLDVAGRTHYCDQTGGDYYDFIDLAPTESASLLVAVGDVMGHGIAAALLMASARAALRTQAMDRPELAGLLTKTNRILALNNRKSRFMTLALLKIDGKARRITWASAGHDPTILFDPRSDVFEDLEGGDLPLGLDPSVEYQEFAREALVPGAILVIGTDGVWEMPDDHNIRFGKDRVQEVVRRNHKRSAKEIAAALEESLTHFRASRAPEDDVTFVIVKVREQAAV